LIVPYRSTNTTDQLHIAERIQYVFLVQSYTYRMDELHDRQDWNSHFEFLFSVTETMEKKLVEATKQLELDLNDERLRYQNLLNEFSRLEERYDDLKDEMNLMVVSG